MKLRKPLLRTLKLVVKVQIPLGCNTYLLFKSLCGKPMRGGGKHYLVNFSSFEGALIVGEVGQKVSFGAS